MTDQDLQHVIEMGKEFDKDKDFVSMVVIFNYFFVHIDFWIGIRNYHSAVKHQEQYTCIIY